MSDPSLIHDAVRAESLAVGWDTPVIRGASFALPMGKVTAVIGPNGSGKSTLLHAIAGLIEPKDGSLEVLGNTPKGAQRDVSYVMQTTRVPEGIPLTVRETVRMGRYANLGWLKRFTENDRQRVQDAMVQLDVVGFERRHLGELSGGQRQRVAVAQGLAQDHRVLLLDEPLAGLDIRSMQTIDRIIHAETKHGCSVILTTHDLDEARAADFVLLVGQGSLIAGLPETVLTAENLRNAYGLSPHPPIDDAGTELPTPHH